MTRTNVPLHVEFESVFRILIAISIGHGQKIGLELPRCVSGRQRELREFRAGSFQIFFFFFFFLNSEALFKHYFQIFTFTSLLIIIPEISIDFC